MKCGEHAKLMAALSPGVMGPAVQALYDRFMENPDEECIAAESQVVFLFQTAMTEDLKAKT